MKASCFNGAWRQGYGNLESCVKATLAGLVGTDQNGTPAQATEAIESVESLAVVTVTILALLSTIQIIRGRRGVWRQLQNGIAVIGRVMRYFTNVNNIANSYLK